MNKLFFSLVTATLLAGFVPAVLPGNLAGMAQAAPAPIEGGGSGDSSSDCVQIGVPIEGNNKCVGKTNTTDINQNPIVVYAKMIIRFLGGIIVLVIIISIVWGALRYIASSGNPQAVAEAKSRITNALIGLVLWILMFGILQVLIPGGLFG